MNAYTARRKFAAYASFVEGETAFANVQRVTTLQAAAKLATSTHPCSPMKTRIDKPDLTAKNPGFSIELPLATLASAGASRFMLPCLRC